ncbi:hypothetical protein GJ744_003079 [Endocarpon pusillum]|uniref:Uncharacterized protein n=1 Tax=Endocarpon pusillum TaxID=364733 RepID=A0A8H7ARG8_9EURO|nr:hypothetical protein GJ744_003079 [Endocarpon pusillum]
MSVERPLVNSGFENASVPSSIRKGPKKRLYIGYHDSKVDLAKNMEALEISTPINNPQGFGTPQLPLNTEKT